MYNHRNSCGKLLKQSSVYDMIIKKSIVLQGGLTFHFNRMGVMPMKKRKHKKSRKIKVSLMELLTFGIFLLALLTFIFTFCK